MNATPSEFYTSNYERNTGDRYFTERPVTAALARRMPAGLRVWEPCAGRGDMAEVLCDFGFETVASDIDTSEFDPGICPIHEYNFLTTGAGRWKPSIGVGSHVNAIVTNPPFGREAERVVRRSLEYTSIRYHAFLLRTVWSSALGRFDLFTDPQYSYAYEIKLLWRPRWDWWFRDKAEKSPMHNYSWFVFDREWTGPNTTFFAKKES